MSRAQRVAKPSVIQFEYDPRNFSGIEYVHGGA